MEIKDKKNILFLSTDGLTDPLGQSQILPYLTRLSEFHYQITIISAEKPINFETGKQEINSLCAGSNIKWQPVNYKNKPPVVGTLLMLWSMLKLAKEIQKTSEFKLIHCRSYLAGIIGLRLKAQWSVPMIFDMRGLWADERIDGNIWSLSNPLFGFIYKLMKRAEIKLISESDAIISLTNKAIPVLQKLNKNSVSHQFTQVIPCCADTSVFNPEAIDFPDKSGIRLRLGLKENDFVLCYQGSLSTWYLPMEMLTFFKRLQKKINNAKLLIITKEAPQPFINMARELGIKGDDIIFTKGNRSEMPLLISLSTLAICFIKPTFSKIASSPVKVGEILSMGIPVVCNKGIGDLDDQMNSTGAGVICQGFNETAYDDAIIKAIDLTKNKTPGFFRNAALELFDLSKGVELYKAVYDRLLIRNDDTVHSSE